MTPRERRTVPLRDLLVEGRIIRGAQTGKPRSETESPRPVVGIRALEGGRVDHGAVELLAVRSERDEERAGIRPGDVLLSKVAPYTLAVADARCTGYVLSQNLFILRFREGIDPWLMAEYLASPGVRAELAARGRGSAPPLLSIKDLETLEVPLLSERRQADLTTCLEAYRDYEALARQEEALVGRIKEALVARHLGVRR